MTRALADDMEQRFGPRPQVAVVPDGVRLAARRPPAARHTQAGRSSPMPDISMRGKAWTSCSRRWPSLPDVDGLIVGGHEREPDLARHQGGGRAAGRSRHA